MLTTPTFDYSGPDRTSLVEQTFAGKERRLSPGLLEACNGDEEGDHQPTHQRRRSHIASSGCRHASCSKAMPSYEADCSYIAHVMFGADSSRFRTRIIVPACVPEQRPGPLRHAFLATLEWQGNTTAVSWAMPMLNLRAHTIDCGGG